MFSNGGVFLVGIRGHFSDGVFEATHALIQLVPTGVSFEIRQQFSELVFECKGFFGAIHFAAGAFQLGFPAFGVDPFGEGARGIRLFLFPEALHLMESLYDKFPFLIPGVGGGRDDGGGLGLAGEPEQQHGFGLSWAERDASLLEAGV